MANLDLVLAIKAVDDASAALKNVSSGLGGVEQAASKGHGPLTALGGALGNVASIASGFVIGKAITELPGFLMDAAKAAAEDEQAAVRVSTLLQTLPGDFAANTAAVNEAIAAGQKLAFSDDDVRDSFVKLAAATGDTDEALAKQKVAMDLARGAHIPLNEASKLLGKLTDENLQVFKRMGITLTDVSSEADVLAAVQAKFAGQSEAYASSTAGQFEQAQIAFHETEEAIGAALLPALTRLAKFLADSLPTIQAFVGDLSSGFSEYISPALDVAIAQFAVVVDWLKQNEGAMNVLKAAAVILTGVWIAHTAAVVAHSAALAIAGA